MAKRGRPRKAGKRYPSGKLVAPYDKGAEHVQARREKYGNHYTTALGRAFASGLLGDDAQAQARYDAAKRFARLYSVYVEQGRYGCPLGREQRSLGVSGQNTGKREEQDWLFACMKDLDAVNLRPWLDLLILDYYHDVDPPFLARLLNKGRDPADKAMLARCIDALDTITPAVEIGRLRVVRA